MPFNLLSISIFDLSRKIFSFMLHFSIDIFENVGIIKELSFINQGGYIYT